MHASWLVLLEFISSNYGSFPKVFTQGSQTMGFPEQIPSANCQAVRRHGLEWPGLRALRGIDTI